MPNSADSGLENPAHYDTSIPGVVVDKVTGLMWQQPVSSQGYTLSSGLSYCRGLSLAGYSDWRLPTVIELYSLVDFAVVEAQGLAIIDPVAFPNTPLSYGAYWTSTPVTATGLPSGSDFWVIDFFEGFAGSNSRMNATYNTYSVRCVR
jgi:hypothetical protein